MKLFHSLDRIKGPFEINTLLHDGLGDPNDSNRTSPS